MGWCIKGLENCVRLKVCTWTRDGSLTSAVLKSLGGCPELTDITVNGDHSWHYEPMDLVQLLGLRKISLIMPSMSVLGILPIWLQGTGQSLISLTLVCKVSLCPMHTFDCVVHPWARKTYTLPTASLCLCHNIFHG